MYDEKVEQQEFPSPRLVPKLKLAVDSGDETLVVEERFALHHKIRNQDTLFGQSIVQFDMLFRLYPDDITSQQIEEYEATLRKAEVSELSEAEVVVCTCMTSARTLIKQGCNVNQVCLQMKHYIGIIFLLEIIKSVEYLTVRVIHHDLSLFRW